MAERITIFAPVGLPPQEKQAGPVGLDRPWDEVTFALVDNGKPGAVPLLNGIADALQIPAQRRLVIPKQIASTPMNEDELNRIKANCQAAILAVGNCGSCTSWTCHDAVTVATKLGIPSVLIVTTPFIQIGEHVAKSLGYPQLPIIVVAHPVGDVAYDIVYKRGEAAAPAVREALTAGQGAQAGAASAREELAEPESISVDADQAAIDAFFLSHNWSDGLPIVAPTQSRVESMLGRHRERADEVIGAVATGYGRATYRSIAINAVMAGCLPEYFDVVVAAVKAAIQPAYNLHAIQATTHPVGPMILVNGPIAQRIGMNAGTNAFGPGNRANATIGRALRLVLQNVGRCVPGVDDRATFGHPGKYTFCIPENEAESPWEPFHVSRGFSASASTVTLFGAEAPHNMNDPASVSADCLLKTFIGCMTTPGSNHHQFPRTEPLVMLAPEHARLLTRHGHTRRSLQEYFFENARIPLSAFSAERIERFLSRRRPVWFGPENRTGMAALADSPEDFLIAVGGGPGTHSMFIPSFGGTAAVTVQVEDGTNLT